jgi:hypothetical protein
MHQRISIPHSRVDGGTAIHLAGGFAMKYVSLTGISVISIGLAMICLAVAAPVSAQGHGVYHAQDTVRQIDPVDGGPSPAVNQMQPGNFGLPHGSQITGGLYEPRQLPRPHYHEGFDMQSFGPDGQPISTQFRAGEEVSGVVESVGGADNTITVRMANGNTMEYLHGVPLVHVGQQVGPSTVLGTTGNVGPGNLPIHLHIQAHDRWGHAIDPRTALPGRVIQRLPPQRQPARPAAPAPSPAVNSANPHPNSLFGILETAIDRIGQEISSVGN